MPPPTPPPVNDSNRDDTDPPAPSPTTPPNPCLDSFTAYQLYGGSAIIGCTRNTDCTNAGEKCLIDRYGYNFFCGNPNTWEQTYPICDDRR